MNPQGKLIHAGKWQGGLQFLHPHDLPAFTTNPIYGCGFDCKWGADGICFAKALHDRKRGGDSPEFSHIQFKYETIEKMKARVKPAVIWVCNMGDMFWSGVEKHMQNAVFDVIDIRPQHIFYILTKAPITMRNFLTERYISQNKPIPRNVWFGASMPPRYFGKTDLGKYTEVRGKWLAGAMNALQDIKEHGASVIWMSFEPLWFDVVQDIKEFGNDSLWESLDWTIIGGLRVKPVSKDKWKETIYPPNYNILYTLVETLKRFDVKIFGLTKTIPQGIWDTLQVKHEYPYYEMLTADEGKPKQMSLF